jgi:hypothetical protein|tara:strand:+ start:260 stop:421 length:162 start_codon:yes stop_codon:yes gene_type:complete
MYFVFLNKCMIISKGNSYGYQPDPSERMPGGQAFPPKNLSDKLAGEAERECPI